MCERCKSIYTKEMNELYQVGEGMPSSDIEELFGRVEKVVKEQTKKHLDRSKELEEQRVVDIEDYEREEERVDRYQELMLSCFSYIRSDFQVRRFTDTLIWLLMQLQLMTRD